MQSLAQLPKIAAWSLEGDGRGFEVAQFKQGKTRVVITGNILGATTIETRNISYTIELSKQWRTQSAKIVSGDATTYIESDDKQRWWVNGVRTPSLDGLYDIDLEASVLTNTISIHRLDLQAGRSLRSDAVYVRNDIHVVEVIEQTYALTSSNQSSARIYYSAPAFDYNNEIVVDRYGLVQDYPGIGKRVL